MRYLLHVSVCLVLLLPTACGKRSAEAGGQPSAPAASAAGATVVPEVGAATTTAPPKVSPMEDPALPGIEAPTESLVAKLRAAYDAKPEGYSARTHHKDGAGRATFVNRLIFETSPYLLQHAHNPVNWYPWGDEAFARAKKLKRPVLMSIGYSTCHWCHVMERESFEDKEIAAYINANFVAVKVDREERPDVDDIYMKAVNILAGRGGWPMTTVLTHQRQPFFGGTYFPARDGDRGSRKGFFTILKELKKTFDESPETVVADAARISAQIARQSGSSIAGGLADEAGLAAGARNFARQFDPEWGGFGRRPKFPRPSTYEYLLRYHRRTGDPQALKIVSHSLTKMADGGMHDQLGGGFHRYSVDDRWLVPHFEKMLYDNAQLTSVYLEAYQVTQNVYFKRVAERTLDYVLREMTDAAGGFYSATDADSPAPNGHDEEGLYFTWTPAEIDELLGTERAKTFKQVHKMTERGNFERRNILFMPGPLEHIATDLKLDPAKLRRQIDEDYATLYPIRAKRQPPILDDKIITAWNGLMISALARGALVLGRDDYAAAAAKAASFLLTNLRTPTGRLRRTHKDGQARFNGYLKDYAFLIAGLLDLHEATFDKRWLERAIELQATLDKHHLDTEAGGYFTTSDDHEKLITRDKPSYDGAEPSGNSVTALNLLRLAELTTDHAYKARAEELFKAFGIRLSSGSSAVPKLMSALDYYLDTPREVILVMPAGGTAADAKPLLDTLRASYLPNRVVLGATVGPELDAHAKVVPLLSGKVAVDGKPTAYVCEMGRCEQPTSDAEVFARQLRKVVKPLQVSDKAPQKLPTAGPSNDPPPYFYNKKTNKHWHPGHRHWHNGPPPKGKGGP